MRNSKYQSVRALRSAGSLSVEIIRSYSSATLAAGLPEYLWVKNRETSSTRLSTPGKALAMMSPVSAWRGSGMPQPVGMKLPVVVFL